MEMCWEIPWAALIYIPFISLNPNDKEKLSPEVQFWKGKRKKKKRKQKGSGVNEKFWMKALKISEEKLRKEIEKEKGKRSLW